MISFDYLLADDHDRFSSLHGTNRGIDGGNFFKEGEGRVSHRDSR